MQIKAYYGVDPKNQGFFWPTSDQKRKEYFSVKRGSPADAESVYQCNPGAREGFIFIESDFAYFSPPPGLSEGIDNPSVQHFLSEGDVVIQAWDTAFTATSTADWSVCITAALRPCTSYHRDEDITVFGPPDPHYDVLVLDVFRDRLDWAGLLPAAKKQYKKWRPMLVLVEKKASGLPVISAMQAGGLAVEGADANISKRARAIQGVGAGSVQGWFRMHRVLFPIAAEWLDKLKIEFKDFTGDESGVDDQVDAGVHLISWAIRTGGSLAMLPTGWSIETVDKNMGRQLSENNPLPGLIELLGESRDPLQYCCARCINYSVGRCPIHNRLMLPFDSCDSWTDGKSQLGVVNS